MATIPLCAMLDDPNDLKPLYSHPPWFYRVIATCVIVLTMVAIEQCSTF